MLRGQNIQRIEVVAPKEEEEEEEEEKEEEEKKKEEEGKEGEKKEEEGRRKRGRRRRRRRKRRRRKRRRRRRRRRRLNWKFQPSEEQWVLHVPIASVKNKTPLTPRNVHAIYITRDSQEKPQAVFVNSIKSIFTFSTIKRTDTIISKFILL
jgi:hypothetical protein